MVRNLNCIKDHNESREQFVNKLKGYNIDTDPLKLGVKNIKEYV
jgi:hypothetical protein